MPKRKSPATGRDGNGPSSDDILKALATEIIDQQAMTEIKERRKRNRKRAEADGVALAHLDKLYKMRDEPASEIEKFFRLQWQHFSAFFSDLAEQLDLFVPRLSTPRATAHRHVGKMAGLKGEKDTPPDGYSGDEIQQWMEGYQEGWEARSQAQEDTMEALKEALNNAEAGKVTDGTGKGKRSAKAKAVAMQAAADFEADQAFIASETATEAVFQ